MAKRTHVLTALGLPKLRLKISKITGKTPKRARFADGGNLFFVIDANGSKTWSFIYSRNGQTREIGLGAYPGIDLKKARGKAGEYREMLRNGADPKEEKARSKRPVLEEGATTFGEAMEVFLSKKGAEWRNARNIRQTRTLMREHCGKIIGVQASQVRTDDVLKIVRPVYARAPVQASRLRRLMEGTLKVAYILDELNPKPPNPARWRDHLADLLPKRKSTDVVHHHALPYKAIPGLVAAVRDLQGDAASGAINVNALAFEFLILTAARTDEVLAAKWTEIDFEERAWSVPAGRMKSARTHRVPLSDAALRVLDTMPRIDGNPFVFPGRDRPAPQDQEEDQREGQQEKRRRRPRKKPAPLTPKTFTRLLGRLGRKTTTHGLRSCFRDWCGEETEFPREVAEAALAHIVGDETELAYRRGDAFKRRRELMDAWSAYLEPPPGDKAETALAKPVRDHGNAPDHRRESMHAPAEYLEPAAAAGNVVKFPQRA
jgi:integrase